MELQHWLVKLVNYWLLSGCLSVGCLSFLGFCLVCCVFVVYCFSVYFIACFLLFAMAIPISSLNASTPLPLHANDSYETSLISLKLTSAENYKVWANVMKLAIQTKNKMGFITSSCLKTDYAACNLLSDQWDRCNVVVLSWILGSLSQDFYLGHVFSNNVIVWKELQETYDKIDGNNNWNNGGMNNANGNNGNRGNYNNLVCKNCGLKGHTIERCFEIIGYPPSLKRNSNLKPANNFNNNGSNNVDNKETFVRNNEIKTSSGTLSFTNKHVLKLMSLLNDKSRSTAHASMAGANQHMTNSDKNMIHLVDISKLKLIVGHPNELLQVPMTMRKDYLVEMVGCINVLGSITDQPGHDGDHLATPLDEQNTFEGNVSRTSKLPARLDEFVLFDKVKCGLNRYANHSFLRPKIYCIVSNMNKCNELSSYEEDMKDVNWVNAMNEEMHALYENKTWTMIDLPYD
nr:ribonuclease H-like domain-containing protein [Tanacetum cinerariifolium]